REDVPEYLAAYLLARGLGHRSRSQALLICFSFDLVYFPVLQSRLSAEAWRLIDQRLPRSWAPWLDWDSGQRLRDAVMGAFVDRNLSPSNFINITVDDEVFGHLAAVASNTGRGRRFLKESVRCMKTQSGRSPQRLKFLQQLIDS